MRQLNRVCDYISWARHWIQGKPYIVANIRDPILHRLGYFESDCKRKQLRILEVGSYRGHSALIWANYGLVTCVDLWHDMLHKRIFDSNIHRFDKNQYISGIRGFSQNVLPTLPRKAFDLIYIDGQHDYQTCMEDLVNSKVLIKPGGLICVDDYDQLEVAKAVSEFTGGIFSEQNGVVWFRSGLA